LRQLYELESTNVVNGGAIFRLSGDRWCPQEQQGDDAATHLLAMLYLKRTRQNTADAILELFLHLAKQTRFVLTGAILETTQLFEVNELFADFGGQFDLIDCNFTVENNAEIDAGFTRRSR
jgi:predicted Zn-dependent peptidase